MAKHIIFETLNDVKQLTTQRGSDGLMRLSGTFGVCGVKNNNQRIYVKENYSKMVQQLKNKIANEGCPGELEHPNTMNITLENISHKIDDINIDENGVVSGTITLLNTPKGKIAQSIVEGGLPLFISSRAQGVVDKNTGVVTLESLQTFDLVGTPGFSQARLHLNESELAQAGAITESCYYLTIEHDNDEVNETKEEENKSEDNIMEDRIKELQEQIETLRESLANIELQHNEQVENLRESFNDFIANDFANAIETWLCEEYEPMINETLTEKIANGVETWVTEHYSPQVEKWVVEHFSPEIERWVATEYSGELQNWMVEHFSPEIERWVNEEYSDAVTGWVNEHLRPELSSMIKESINESRRTSLDTIDKTLEMLEEMKVEKPTYSRKRINENVNEPLFLQRMPEAKRVEWNMLSESEKETVCRRASLRDLTTNESIERFWNDVDLTKQTVVTPVTETLNQYQDTWEAQQRQMIRNWRKR